MKCSFVFRTGKDKTTFYDFVLIKNDAFFCPERNNYKGLLSFKNNVRYSYKRSYYSGCFFFSIYKRLIDFLRRDSIFFFYKTGNFFKKFVLTNLPFYVSYRVFPYYHIKSVKCRSISFLYNFFEFFFYFRRFNFFVYSPFYQMNKGGPSLYISS